MVRKIKAALVAGAIALGTVVLAAPAEANTGCTRVGNWAEWCDDPPVDTAGDHWHCEQSPFHYLCGWRDAANRPISGPGGN